jgi:hypothetical protein
MEWDKYPDEEAGRNYRELKTRMEETFRKVRKTKDLRDAKALLIELQGGFKGTRLRREDREELYGMLQEEFARINRVIEEERQGFEQQAMHNYLELKSKVDEGVFLASHPKDFKETWDLLISIQADFKGTRLKKEHREELYNRLQGAFDRIKAFQDQQRSGFEAEAAVNYEKLQQWVEDALIETAAETDFRKAKEILMKVQAELREARLLREQKDELFTRVRSTFDQLTSRQQEVTMKIQAEAATNYEELKPLVREISALAGTSDDFRVVRERFREVQDQVRGSGLLREQREELLAILQEAFKTLNLRQDAGKESFEKEARANYARLKTLVGQGLRQAEETNQYKETREFLKKIQSEFKGIKLIREQREELYARLQTAFDILGKRLDEYFRMKKKNWEVKMNYKVTEYSTEIFDLGMVLEKERSYLKELEDQLEIVESAGKEKEAAESLKARISDTRRSIEKKEQEAASLQASMNDLKSRLEGNEPAE